MIKKYYAYIIIELILVLLLNVMYNYGLYLLDESAFAGNAIPAVGILGA